MIMPDMLMSLKSHHRHDFLVPVCDLEMYNLMPLRGHVMLAAACYLHLLSEEKEYLIGGQTIPLSPLVVYRVFGLALFPSYYNTQKPLKIAIQLV